MATQMEREVDTIPTEHIVKKSLQGWKCVRCSD